MTTAATLMQVEFPRLSPTMPIRDAAAGLVAAGLSGAPVVDDTGAIVGMLTQKDCFRAALNASYYRQWSGTVREAMGRGALTLAADTELVAAAQAFLDHPHRLFPVTENGRLVGLLHRGDVLAALLAQG